MSARLIRLRVVADRGAILFSLAVLVVLAYAAYEINTGFTTRARLFANAITVPALVLAAFQVIREARRLEAIVSRSALIWAAGFFVALWAIGLQLAIPLFALVYLRLAAGEAWPKAAAYAAVAWLFVELTFVQTLHIQLPAGAIGLPAIIN